MPSQLAKTWRETEFEFSRLSQEAPARQPEPSLSSSSVRCHHLSLSPLVQVTGGHKPSQWIQFATASNRWLTSSLTCWSLHPRPRRTSASPETRQSPPASCALARKCATTLNLEGGSRAFISRTKTLKTLRFLVPRHAVSPESRKALGKVMRGKPAAAGEGGNESIQYHLWILAASFAALEQDGYVLRCAKMQTQGSSSATLP
jgi:hypothetical protein